MNYLSNIYNQIDDIIPDEFIINEVKTLLASTIKNRKITVENKTISIAVNPKIVVLSKLVYKEYYNIDSQPLRVTVSIGETNEECGFILTEYFFITLLYSDSLELIESDYHLRFLST